MKKGEVTRLFVINIIINKKYPLLLSMKPAPDLKEYIRSEHFYIDEAPSNLRKTVNTEITQYNVHNHDKKIPGDGHPTALVNWNISEVFKNILKEDFSPQ